MTVFDIISAAAVMLSVVTAVITYVLTARLRHKIDDHRKAVLRYYQQLLNSPIEFQEVEEAQKAVQATLNGFISALDTRHRDYHFAASVRLLSYPEGDADPSSVAAVTFARDDVNSVGREKLRYYYPVSLNSSLKLAMERKEPYFIKDLRSLTNSIYQTTENPNWTGMYRSVLVWPIIDRDKVIGFFCVDSKKPITEEKELLQEISHLAKPTVELLKRVLRQMTGIPDQSNHAQS